MFIVTVQFQIKPEKIVQFMPLMHKQAATSLQDESDCVQFDVCRTPSDDTLVFLYEKYSSEDAFKAHLKAPHFLQFDADVREMIASKTVETFTIST